MKKISIMDHDFEKQNLVSNKDYSDTYKAMCCGISGKRPPFTNDIIITDADFKKHIRCLKSRRPSLVEVRNVPGIFNSGVYEVIPCPDSDREKYEGDVWIYSTILEKSVRVLREEIIDSDV